MNRRSKAARRGSPPDPEGDTKPVVPAHLRQALAEGIPDPDLSRELEHVEEALRSKGHAEEAANLGQLRQQAHVFRGLGRRLGDVADQVKRLAGEQWQLVLQELSQSREVASLLARRASGEIKSFSAAEEELVRRQVADVFRMVPATALALAPVPGIAVVTPYVLKKLNLLPSAWREAHMIDQLEQTAQSLRDKGEAHEAERIERMADDLSAAGRDREDRARTLRELRGVREMYDFDMDGVINDAEWEAIKSDRAALRSVVAKGANDEHWHFTTQGMVEGPVSLQALRQIPLPDHALVHAPGIDRWIPYELFCQALEPEEDA